MVAGQIHSMRNTVLRGKGIHIGARAEEEASAKSSASCLLP